MSSSSSSSSPIPTTATTATTANAAAQTMRRDANLKLLQRTCRSSITDILVSATHVVLYEYLNNSWHKTAQEGTLFVVVTEQPSVDNNTPQQHALILLNRHSIDNFDMNLTTDFQVQQQDPFLMFKKIEHQNQQRVYGIWFHNPDERQQVYQVLQQSIHSMSTARATSSTASIPTATTLPPELVSNASVTIAHVNDETVATKASAVTAVAESAAPITEASSSSAVPLDKKALQLALLSLLQEDKFVTLLHQQYVKVIRSKQQQKE